MVYMFMVDLVLEVIEMYDWIGKCRYCGSRSSRLHARHDTGVLEELCEYCYKLWHGDLK